MNIYNKIIDTIVKTNDNWFDYNYKPSNNVPYILKVCFAMLQQGRIYKSRIMFFNDQINNVLITNYCEEFKYLFNKIQRIYYVLVRFVNICKYKKAKIIVDMDLQLNEIKEKEIGVLSILHNGKKYLFKSYELVKHINMCLTNSPNFFASPLQIKNPYNGIPFNKSTLYNIYFYIKYNTNMQIELFHKFFINNFNILLFGIENEPIIREYAIKNYINNSTNDILKSHILNMLDDYNFYCPLTNKIEIDNHFPNNKLIKILKPYLKLYLYSLYSLNIEKKRYYQNLLYKKLLLFNKYNNRFGQKIVRTEKVIPDRIGDPMKIIFHHEFSEDHIKYSLVPLDKFMTNHLNIPILNDINNSTTNQRIHTQNNIVSNQEMPINDSIVMMTIVNNLDEVERLIDNIVLASNNQNATMTENDNATYTSDYEEETDTYVDETGNYSMDNDSVS